MIRVYCDKCGVEIRCPTVKVMVRGHQLDREYELCETCAMKIVKMVDEALYR